MLYQTCLDRDSDFNLLDLFETKPQNFEGNTPHPTQSSVSS
jgi:hypothetical protein